MLAITASCAAATGRTHPRAAVARGLQFLEGEAIRWKESGRCAACHHAMTMIWTFNEARAAGLSVDEEALKEVTEWAFQDMKTNSLTEQPPPRNVLNLGWVYLLLSVETAPPLKAPSAKAEPPSAGMAADTNEDVVLSARETLIRQIVAKQVPDGSWGRPLDLRVPLGGPTEDIAILSRLALLESGDRSKAVLGCIRKAATWLAANQDKESRQARNLRLLMGTRERKAAARLKPAIASIRAEQNPDGGWSQTPEMPSDAYATGQTLYVLARAGLKPSAPEMRRGVQFLTSTQREDGSWPMSSRAKAKNLGPITDAGTAWALLGLIRAAR